MSVNRVAASDVRWDASQFFHAFATSDIQLARLITFDRIWARRFYLAVRVTNDSSRWDGSQPTSQVERGTQLDFRVALIACNQGGAAASGHSNALVGYLLSLRDTG